MEFPGADFRSDTVTKPTPEMRVAMANAEVGDDVYGEDPTVNRLEESAANIAGKEAALFLPTGIMANTIAIKLHTQHGQEVICESRAHVLDWELSMMAWFAGCLARPVDSHDGLLRWAQIQPHLKQRGPHNAPTALICLENTHNMAGGTVYPQELLDDVCLRARAGGLKTHVDGARIFNAAVQAEQSVHRILEFADTAMFSLSKGLGAPAGSMLVGSKDLIDEGRLLRKRLGGGMRQSGVLAAAGLIALEKMPWRLREDHVHAAYLAERIGQMPGVRVFDTTTNIVIFDIEESGKQPAAVVAEMKEQGILIGTIGGSRLRMVTHYDVTRKHCEAAVSAMSKIF
jgi:threonine aldolase